MCSPNCTWKTTYSPVNQSCWVKQLCHVHDAWRRDQSGSMWGHVATWSPCVWFPHVYFHVHALSVIDHLIFWRSFLLQCLLMHHSASEKVHKSLQRQIVYSFYEVCNGCVPLVPNVLNPIKNTLSGFDICLYTLYITYSVQFCQELLKWWHGNLDSIV